MVDVLRSLHPEFVRFDLPLDSLGDFNTLSERLKAEVAASKATTPLPTLVSAWQLTSSNTTRNIRGSGYSLPTRGADGFPLPHP